MTLFRKLNAFNIILCLLLLPGIIVAFWRCTFRIMGEKNNLYIELAADFNEFKQLALEDNLHVRDLLNALKEKGASSVVLSEDTLESLEQENKITVMGSREIRKFSLDQNFKIEHPIAQNAIATLWLHSEDTALLSRIEHILSLKIPNDRIIRIHQNLLLINKSTQGFQEKVGLGFSPETIEMLQESNLGIILKIQNYPNLTLDAAEKYFNQLPPPASVSAIMFAQEESFGYRGEHEKIIELLKNRAYRLCDFEFTQPRGMLPYLEVFKNKRLIVKAHSISRKEMDQKYYPTTAIARWVRAAHERSIRLLYLRCFFQNEKYIIDNLADYNLEYLQNTAASLKDIGLVIAQTHAERIAEPRLIVGKPLNSEIFVTGLALLMGLIILLKITIIKKLKNGTVIAFAILSGLLFIVIDKHLWTIVTGIVGAVSYATLGLIWAMNSLKESDKNKTLKIALKFIFKMTLVSVFGGILIVGLHSSLDFMAKYEQFRGIKLAFMLPLLISILWALKLYGSDSIRLLHKPINFFALMLLVTGLVGILIYILRSGNLTIIKPSLAEEQFRIYLEQLLVARPRYKEFLIGYPATFLFAFFFMRKTYFILPPLVLFMQMGQVSVLNSLCHFHTPITLTLLRIFNGLWIGIIIGLATLVMTILLRLFYKISSEKAEKMFLIGYFGFGNGGDELLWQTLAERISKDYPQYQISVLYSEAKTNRTSKYNLIKRSDLTMLIDELLTSKFIVVPGGGVFQSKTSLKSLAYYLTLVAVARLSKAKVIFVSQGLGPWNEKRAIGKLLLTWMGYELKKADYVSFRDEQSLAEYSRLAGKTSSNLTSDLVFLNKGIKKISKRIIHKKISVYAILRSSVKESLQIARDLLKLTATDDTIEIVPISMQPNEDEQVWHDAGWSDEIQYIFDAETLLDGADMLVSMRLHGCILATVACKPWLGITYDPKVEAYASSINWRYFVQPDMVDMDYLKSKINQIKKHRAQLSEELHNNAIDNTRLAEADYQQLISALF